MTTLRQFQMTDLFKFNNINLDVLTETYNMPFYLSYLSRWPEAFTVAQAPTSTPASDLRLDSAPLSASGRQSIPALRRAESSQSQSHRSRCCCSLMGYMLGKSEGTGKGWHGHVSAVTVSPTYRRIGLAKTLMDDLEYLSTDVYNAYFVDLFVRASNILAINMYEKFGYVKYRRVLDYYAGGGGASNNTSSNEGVDEESEDAFDMRKALERDVKRESVIPLKHPVRTEDLEW